MTIHKQNQSELMGETNVKNLNGPLAYIAAHEEEVWEGIWVKGRGLGKSPFLVPKFLSDTSSGSPIRSLTH